MISRLCALALLAAVSACSGPSAIVRGEKEIAAGRYQEGLKTLEEAAAAPGASKEERAALLRNKAQVVARMEGEARVALEKGAIEQASALFADMARLDAEQARAGTRRVEALGEATKSLKKAEAALRAGEVAAAQSLLKPILAVFPEHPQARALAARVAEAAPATNSDSPVLGPDFRKKITLEFRDVGLKAVFDAIWHTSGINFVLDRDIRSDSKATILVRDVTVEEAVEAILTTQGLGKRVLGPKMLFIYPRTPQKTAEYQELLIHNFFLAHVGAKEIQNLLKTILKLKDVYADEKRNLIVVRDTPEKVALAEKLIQAQDQAEPEVMLAVEVIEVNRSRLQDLGITWPQKLEVGVLNPISFQALKTLNGDGISVGVGGFATGGGTSTGILAQLNAASNLGDTKTLANPRIRVRNREKAKIHIGDRLPVVTTNTAVATTNYISQSVNYLDVGLKLEVEPEVMLDNDVIIKLNLEVSSATTNPASSSGSVFYNVGTRNTSTVLTIRDGETQVLAGLIKDDESESSSGMPGFGDLPLLGRLFSTKHSNKTNSEILLAITPHVLRNLQRPTPSLMEYPSGSDNGQGVGASPTNPATPTNPARPTPARAVPTPPSSTSSTSSPLSGLNSSFSSTGTPTTTTGSSGNTGSSATTTTTTTSSAGSATTTTPSTSSTTPTTMSDFEAPPGAGSTPKR